MNYFCCTDTRRSTIRQHPTLNGIDFLEVSDNKTDLYKERQTTLFVHFIKPVVPSSLGIRNFTIEGGERIKNIRVVGISPGAETPFPLSPPETEANVVVVKVSEAGDFSTYTLRLVQDSRTGKPPYGFDPLLSAVDFSFKVSCPSEFDCKPVHSCYPESGPLPEINYLAKDYASFRRLMLDRMALLLPTWKERHPADMGIMLVELLAYVADHLSYRQDAVATEAYLGTARKRVSVRRHARLVDYTMHDGCNARTWVHIQVPPAVSSLTLKQEEGENRTKFITKIKELPRAFRPGSPQFDKALNEGVRFFEMLQNEITLYAAHSKMNFYTFCGKQCCLPKGATAATLYGAFPNLQPGDVLVLSEELGPETGKAQDADPAHQHAVRLTEVIQSYDLVCDAVPGSPPIASPPFSPPWGSPPIGSPPLASPPLYSPPFSSPPNFFPLPITEIKWAEADALPFALCISNEKGVQNISIALGNNVLVDHGLTVHDKAKSSLEPDSVPAVSLVVAGSRKGSFCEPSSATAIPPRYRPKLRENPLTFAVPFDTKNKTQPAKALLNTSVREALPAVTLQETGEEGDLKGNPVWEPRQDLLGSDAGAREFVVEIESDGTAYIRFGDDNLGARPAPETKFVVRYRIGNGVSGNIGARSLAHIITDNAEFLAAMAEEEAAIWNPLPAKGGTEPETIEEVKQYAPSAFRTQERAVTPADYETFAKKCRSDVQRATATMRWTGSWKTVFLSVDRLEGLDIEAGFETALRNCLERYRMAGFDLEVDAPLPVSLEIEMAVCVNPRFFASDVKQALLELFSSRTLPDGRKGLFHPDNFTFGQPVYLSPLIAAAQSTQGVDSVQVTKFQRQGRAATDALQSGKLELGRREIARLSNDRNFPERGIFNLIMQGGRL